MITRVVPSPRPPAAALRGMVLSRWARPRDEAGGPRWTGERGHSTHHLDTLGFWILLRVVGASVTIRGKDGITEWWGIGRKDRPGISCCYFVAWC